MVAEEGNTTTRDVAIREVKVVIVAKMAGITRTTRDMKKVIIKNKDAMLLKEPTLVVVNATADATVEVIVHSTQSPDTTGRIAFAIEKAIITRMIINYPQSEEERREVKKETIPILISLKAPNVIRQIQCREVMVCRGITI